MVMGSFLMSSSQKCVLITLVAGLFVANVQSVCTPEDILACSEGYLDVVNSNPSTKDLCRATRTILDCLYDEMAQCPAEVKTTFETNAQTYLDVAENELDKHCGAGLTSFNLWVLMVVAIFGVTRHFL